MKKLILIFIFVTQVSWGSSIQGQWLGGGGVGLILGPTLVMLSPQLEYVYKTDVTFGSLAQMGFLGDGVLFTVSGTYRRVLGEERAKIRPTFEGGLGLALASSLYASSVGVHIMAGGGIEYVYDKNLTLGSMLRLNFAPPLKSMFVSWPMVIARFKL
ncbi:MAG: hypothetical protein FJ116_09045 [Deltaproteobacteria bacterium]|nr:hypothetical protein [Deltaproteobacteria bacterium]